MFCVPIMKRLVLKHVILFNKLWFKQSFFYFHLIKITPPCEFTIIEENIYFILFISSSETFPPSSYQRINSFRATDLAYVAVKKFMKYSSHAGRVLGKCVMPGIFWKKYPASPIEIQTVFYELLYYFSNIL